MSLDEIQDQPRAVEIMRGALARGQVHHAYLFAGAPGVGKERAARAFLQALNCEKGLGVGCGRCGECRRIAAGNHPDMIWVMPEQEMVARKLSSRNDFGDSPSRDVKIAQVRQLIDRLSLKALSARRKSGVILMAERMNPSAQNALLKTLEEPPAETTLILISSAPDSLLPTIRSRCLRVPFAPLTAVAISQVLQAKGVPAAEADVRARLAQGSMKLAEELSPKQIARRKQLFDAVERLNPQDARIALDLAEALAADRSEVEWVLVALRSWLRDQLVVLSGGDDLINSDLDADVRSAAARTEAHRILDRLRTMEAIDEALIHNAGPRFQLERLFLEYGP